MEVTELKAEKREETGTKPSKRLRRLGKIPAIIYSDGETMSISVDAREFAALARAEAGTHVIAKLDIAGVKEQPNAIIKAVQRNPLKDEFFHIDFQKIKLDETITAMVPVEPSGETIGARADGILEHHLAEVELEGFPGDLPDRLVVDVSGLDIGDSLNVRDIPLPPGVSMLTDPDMVVLTITESQAARVVTEAVEGIAPESVVGSAEEAVAGSEE